MKNVSQATIQKQLKSKFDFAPITDNLNQIKRYFVEISRNRDKQGREQ
jgi:hypothetical protein